MDTVASNDILTSYPDITYDSSDTNTALLLPPVSKTNGLKILPFSPDLTPQDHPGVMVEAVKEGPESETVKRSLTLEEQLRNPVFGALLALTLFGAIVLIINAASNIDVVNIEANYGSGISIG